MNKNLMPDVLKLLGVEYDERFKLTNTDGVITENDVFCFFEHGLSHALQDGEYEDASDILYDILAGNYEIVKLPWEPKHCDAYYVLNVETGRIECYSWGATTFDLAVKSLGIIHRTKEGAEAHLEKDYERLTGRKLHENA